LGWTFVTSLFFNAYREHRIRHLFLLRASGPSLPVHLWQLLVKTLRDGNVDFYHKRISALSGG
jgi:hypothetical protein